MYKNLLDFRDNWESSGEKSNSKNRYTLVLAIFKCFTHVICLILTKPHFVGAISLEFYS